MKILVTGATGYLGSRLCAALAKAGHSVVALHVRHDLNNRDLSLPGICPAFLSDMSIREIFEQYHPEGVIHTATLYGRQGEELPQMISVNVIFPVELMACCVEYGTKFFINTDTILNKRINAYSLTKSHVVDWMQHFADKVQMIDMRLDHFYGPFEKNIKFVAQMFERMRRNDPEIDLTDGRQTRDFIFIDDVVSAYITVLDNIQKIPTGHVSYYEVGTGVRTSIRDLVTKIKDYTSSVSHLNFGAVPYRKNEVLDYKVDISALSALGWKAKVMLDDGLKLVAETERHK